MKALIKKYSHAWVLLYFIFYMQWFTWLERTVTTKFTVIHLDFDDYIPFCEIFVIPYFCGSPIFLWRLPISFSKTGANFTASPHFCLSA